MTKQRCRLLVVIPSLEAGGAERACVNLLRGLDGVHNGGQDDAQLELHLALFYRAGPFLDDVPTYVTQHDLATRLRDPRLVVRLARLIDRVQPDVVLSIMRYTNIVTGCAARLARRRVQLVFNEQNQISQEFALYGGGRFKGAFVRSLYRQAAAVTAISQGIACELADSFDVPRQRLHVIPNSVDLGRVQAMAAAPAEHPWLAGPEPVVLAVGRLHSQKGFSDLLHAFCHVAAQRPARLIILGEGAERTRLEQLAAELGIAERVALPGFAANPFAYMAQAALFVLSSHFEGFGNVLVEALAAGAPVVATRAPSGPEEILQDGVTGLLTPVGDPPALAQAMLRVLDDPALAERLRNAGRLRAADYDIAAIGRRYKELVVGLCAS
jgi:glycosyltransferase involved in cell wall biosynthesis